MLRLAAQVQKKNRLINRTIAAMLGDNQAQNSGSEEVSSEDVNDGNVKPSAEIHCDSTTNITVKEEKLVQNEENMEGTKILFY